MDFRVRDVEHWHSDMTKAKDNVAGQIAALQAAGRTAAEIEANPRVALLRAEGSEAYRGMLRAMGESHPALCTDILLPSWLAANIPLRAASRSAVVRRCRTRWPCKVCYNPLAFVSLQDTRLVGHGQPNLPQRGCYTAGALIMPQTLTCAEGRRQHGDIPRPCCGCWVTRFLLTVKRCAALCRFAGGG